MQGPSTITSVITAAASYLLADLASVKQEANVTDTSSDLALTRYIGEASAAAANYCNRVFPVETVLDRFWPQRDGWPWIMRGGLQPLQLTRWPLAIPPVADGVTPATSPVASVTEHGVSLVENTDFIVDAAKGELVRIDQFGYPRRWPAMALVIQYSAGYNPIPADVSGAVIRMVSQRFFAKGRDPNLRGETIPGVYQANYWVSTISGSGASDGNLTPDVQALLDNYRVPVFA